jgi:KUP system potassium uptake protein
VTAHGTKTPATALLALGALGVVFGDIGTSPLYAFQAAIATGVGTDRTDILGLLSLFLWALILIVGVKYIGLVMRVSNNGEGGVLALSALARRTLTGRTARWAVLAGLVGVGLFYADGVITPAISVLSAGEGITVNFPSATALVVPFAIVVVTILFIVQRFGTDKIAKAFGPIMLLWFIVIALLGLKEVVAAPFVLQAFNPADGVMFLGRHPAHGLAVLGAVVLCVTGVETLYADMGHFGRKPIALAWLAVGFPCVVIAYLGQGALVMTNPAAASNPFFNMGPSAAGIPLLILATVATFIASQSVISGVFSMTRQAIQLDLQPRQRVVHTSEEMEGQIYMPFPTIALYAVVIAFIVTFGSSEALAAAYGFAIAATMVITTGLTMIMARNAWGWNPTLITLCFAPLLLIDLLLFSATCEKVPHGGWVSMVMAILLLIIMVTWRRGRAVLRRRIAAESLPIDRLATSTPVGQQRIPGVTVFMAANPKVAPHSLAIHLKHNKLLPEHLVLVSVRYRTTPRVDPSARVLTKRIGEGITAIEIWYGYVEQPDIPPALASVWGVMGLPNTPRDASYVVSDDTLVITRDHIDGMPHWQKRIFGTMHRNAAKSADFFRLPAGQVIHLGTEVSI